MKRDLIKIILVETMGAINLGSIARLCVNFGINELRLVSPKCNPNDPEAIKMAVKGAKLLKNAKVYISLIDAISDCSRVIATCGRLDHGNIPIHKTKNTIDWISSSQVNLPLAIIFGREDRGLTNNELLLANKVISLETCPSYPSLNLSHSVGIFLYELFKYNNKELNFRNKKLENIAGPKQINDLLEDTKNLLFDIGFLLEHTAEARMSKLKILLQRAEISSEEVALIRGMLRQTRWAIENKYK